MKDLPFSKKKSLHINIDDLGGGIKDLEYHLQKQCEEYLQYLNIPYIRIPDWLYYSVFGKQSNVEPKIKRFISKYLKGLPDIMIFKRDENSYNKALFIELKNKYGKLSQGQKNFAKQLNLLVVRNFDDFKKEVDKFVGVYYES